MIIESLGPLFDELLGVIIKIAQEHQGEQYEFFVLRYLLFLYLTVYELDEHHFSDARESTSSLSSWVGRHVSVAYRRLRVDLWCLH